MQVRLEPATVSVAAGERFTFRSTVVNETGRTATGLIAHLNVTALDAGVYVDPEDWSTARTRYLAPLPSGASRKVSWRVQAVGGGRFLLYVAVLQPADAQAVTGSGVLRLHVAERRTLAASSATPVVAGVPVLLLGLMAVQAGRRRRLR